MLLASLAGTSTAARAAPTRLICEMSDSITYLYQDEPTIVELDEAAKTVTVQFSAEHFKDPGGISGGADGHGGSAASRLGPVPATYEATTITFKDANGTRHVINRLTGAFYGLTDNGETWAWNNYKCSVAQAKF